jgi:penicillin-binding protein 2
MRLALLKDPDVRKRIERPLPMPELPPDMGPADGPNVAPDATQAMAPVPDKPA